MHNSFDDAVEDVELSGVLVEVADVATLFKLFFREMPTPLLTKAFCDKMVAEQTGASPRDLALMMMPAVKREALRTLMACLARVHACPDNLMTANNLGVCFAPTLCEVVESTDANESFAMLQVSITMVKKVIEEAEDTFGCFEGGLFEGYPAFDGVIAAAADPAPATPTAEDIESPPSPAAADADADAGAAKDPADAVQDPKTEAMIPTPGGKAGATAPASVQEPEPAATTVEMDNDGEQVEEEGEEGESEDGPASPPKGSLLSAFASSAKMFDSFSSLNLSEKR